ncbi:saccharopine dehydrogenase family protein [Marilutibacter alkalisoli]|uniref:NAD-dependent epimerase/dehydratase family protein n=1 Tax=Marilutibacter alkalisoli TaxID=2591633 RepID=A0A514BQJ7_9GAMM|nr:NAD(P)H-binding protein [Lysobacter alkalisoli]QDH69647.1 NAD-dependent epimerase/dehydratase family protein [Lysobacter alkalisoli]
MNQQNAVPVAVPAAPAVAVYGANGHTGKFVVAELRRRGIPVIAVGRDPTRLPADVPARAAALDDPSALERAFAGCAVVINCAGPFLDTATPVVEAALRAGCSYLDVTAEQASAQATFEAHDRPAREAGVVVIPAAGFYGGLADLLASAVAGEAALEELTTAVALDRWWPTDGTRRTGERNRVPRVVVEDGRLVPMAQPGESRDWSFAASGETLPMAELPFSEVVTISRHLPVRRLRSYLNAAALGDVRDAGTPAPTAVDAQGRSAQRFEMEVVAVDAAGTRRASARGQDIYAVSAPIVAEAAARILDPSFKRSGAFTLGEAFDARDFLHALARTHLTVAFDSV